MQFIVALLALLLNLYSIGLIVYAVTSWIQHPTAYKVRGALEPYYEPLLKPIRQLLGTLNLGGVGIDFSPIILWLLLTIFGNLIFGMLV